MKARIEFDINDSTKEELYILLVDLRMDKNRCVNVKENIEKVFLRAIDESIINELENYGINNIKKEISEIGDRKRPVIEFLSKCENSVINALLAMGESEVNIAQEIEAADKASEKSVTLFAALLGRKSDGDKNSN